MHENEKIEPSHSNSHRTQNGWVRKHCATGSILLFLRRMGVSAPLRIDKKYIWLLEKALKADHDQKVKLKIRALLLIAKGKHVPEAAKTLAIKQRSVCSWVHKFLKDGLAGLENQAKGRPRVRACRLSTQQLRQLKERIDQGPLSEDKVCFFKGKDILRIIREEFDVEYKLAGLYYLLHEKLGMSYVRPQPHHHKLDKAVHEVSKKTPHFGWQSNNSNIQKKNRDEIGSVTNLAQFLAKNSPISSPS